MKLSHYLLTLYAGCLTALHASAQQTPNIVFILSDDQAYNTIHAWGNQLIQTPNLDQLVRMGTSFKQACIMGGKQGAICAPSRAMILTGRDLFTLSGQLGEIPDSDTTLPMLLRQNGYFTFATGKWHNSRRALHNGFDSTASIFLGGMHTPGAGGHFQPRLRSFDPSGRYPDSLAWTGNKFASAYFGNAAAGFIKSRTTAQPFFCYVAFSSPHDPRTPPAGFAAKYDPSKIPLPVNYLPQHPFNNGELSIRDERLLPWPREKDALKKEIAAYYAMISAMDAQVGSILNALKQTGKLHNTIIVFASDNGLSMGAQGLLGKQNLYEEAIRVPLIIAGPGIPKNATRNALVYLADVYPALAAMLQLKAPNHTGPSTLYKTLAEPDFTPRTFQYLVYRDLQRGLRNNNWKLIVYRVKGVQKEQLFDLKKDPFERKNLAEDPAYAAKKKELTTLLRTEAARLNDPFVF